MRESPSPKELDGILRVGYRHKQLNRLGSKSIKMPPINKRFRVDLGENVRSLSLHKRSRKDKRFWYHVKNENEEKVIKSSGYKYIEVEISKNMGTGVMTPMSTSYSNDF